MASLVAHTVAGSTDGGNSVTTSAIDTTGATLLVVSITGAINDIHLPSDSKSNTWTGLSIATAPGGVSNKLFYAENPIVGSGHTFDFSVAGTYPSIEVLAFSGAATTSVFDVDSWNSSNTSPTISVGPVTPSGNGYIIVSGLYDDSATVAPSIDSGFTVSDSIAQNGGNSYGSAAAYLIQGTAASVTPTWTKNNGISAATLAVFVASGGAGSPWYYYAQQ